MTGRRCRTTTPSSSSRSSRAIGGSAGRSYGGTMEPADVSMRVIADHIRATTFLIADGVVPSNEWRGYVLRKIMRRAMRHGRKLGLNEPFLFTARRRASSSEMGGAYPELKTSRDAIVQVVRSEEERFGVVLTEGLPRLEDVLDQAARGDRRSSPATRRSSCTTPTACRATSSRTWPARRASRFDAEGFEQAMQASAREGAGEERVRRQEGESSRSRATRPERARDDAPTTFDGYDDDERQRRRSSSCSNETASSQVEELPRGRDGLRRCWRQTPFYLEAGRTGVGRRAGSSRRRQARRRVSGLARIGAGFHRVEVERARPARSVAICVTADGRCRAARCDAAQSHGDAPAARGAAAGARHARQAGRVARGAGSPALRLRPLQRADAPSELRAHRAARQRAHRREHAGRDRGAQHAGSDRGGRDGALRREVRRPRARRHASRASASSCAAARTCARPATSARSSSPRNRASRPVCAASRRSPAWAPTPTRASGIDIVRRSLSRTLNTKPRGPRRARSTRSLPRCRRCARKCSSSRPSSRSAAAAAAPRDDGRVEINGVTLIARAGERRRQGVAALAGRHAQIAAQERHRVSGRAVRRRQGGHHRHRSHRT